MTKGTIATSIFRHRGKYVRASHPQTRLQDLIYWAMKHVGMNVTPDLMMTLAYTGVRGALVICNLEETFREVICARTKAAFADANMKCFDAGLQAANNAVER